MWKHYDPSNTCSYLPNNTKQPSWRTCIVNMPFVFYFYTTLFSSWRPYVPANAIYEMCGELTPSPLSWCMWKDARKVRRGDEGTVYRAGSLRNFRSTVAAAIVWHCNICWWIDVNYVATGLLNKSTNHRVPQNRGNFLAKSEIIRFSRMILV
jgi:hypothetical protein